MTNEEFIELIPDSKVRALLWNEVVDMNGK